MSEMLQTLTARIGCCLHFDPDHPFYFNLEFHETLMQATDRMTSHRNILVLREL